jgi:hypothetical protein
LEKVVWDSGESPEFQRLYSDGAGLTCVDRLWRLVIIDLGGKIGKPLFF